MAIEPVYLRIYCVLQCCFCDVFNIQLELFVMFIKSVVGYRQQMYSSPTERAWKCERPGSIEMAVLFTPYSAISSYAANRLLLCTLRPY